MRYYSQEAKQNIVFHEKSMAVVRTQLAPKDSLPRIRDVGCDIGNV